MPIVTISRGSYYHGKAIAEKLAERLGYTCLSRDQVVEQLDQFHQPEIRLKRELSDAFAVLDRFPHGKERFKTAIRSAILQRFLTGNVVYHGLVGHHFVSAISHVLKVRILADIEKRVADEMARENISEDKARYILKKDDEERRKWGMFLYGIDVMDSEMYNLTIRIGHLSADDAVETIANVVRLRSFQETDESRAALADEALNAMICMQLFDFPHAAITVKNKRVRITLKAPEDQQSVIHDRIHQMLAGINEIGELQVQFDPYF